MWRVLNKKHAKTEQQCSYVSYNAAIRSSDLRSARRFRHARRAVAFPQRCVILRYRLYARIGFYRYHTPPPPPDGWRRLMVCRGRRRNRISLHPHTSAVITFAITSPARFNQRRTEPCLTHNERRVPFVGRSAGLNCI